MFQSAIPLLRIKDAERSRALFESMGFKLLWEHQDAPDSPRFAEVHRDGVSFFLSEHDGDGPFGVQVYVVVDDANALYQLFRLRGIACTVEPHDTEWNHRVFELEDYDGNTLRFGSPMV